MKRRDFRSAPAIALATLVVGCVLGVQHFFGGNGPGPHEQDAYNGVLQTYIQAVKPGMTREQLRAYLKSRNTSFTERCCDTGFRAYSLLVTVGHLTHPWYCSVWPVYAAFEFEVKEPYDKRFPVDPETRRKVEQYGIQLMPSASDILEKIQLVSNGEGCL